MADPLTDPFASDPSTDQGNIANEWSTALGDPQVRTALLQFGISMLQPPSFGDNTGAQVGRAIGSAGEALGRQDEMARKQLEAESKSDLRTSQAQLAESRAAKEGQASDFKNRELDLKQKAIEDKAAAARLSNIIKEQGMRARTRQQYDTYLKEVEKRNNDPLRPRDKPPEKPLPLEEWARSVPSTTGIGGRSAIPSAAVDALIANPALRDDFNTKYGGPNYKPADDFIGPE